MKIFKIHQRFYKNNPILMNIIPQLCSPNQTIWPIENWPALQFNDGVKLEAHGGVATIRYRISEILPNSKIVFSFTTPKQFNGIQRFDVNPIGLNMTEFKHTTEIVVGLKGYIYWHSIIKWLHNALMEDMLNKISGKVAGEEIQTSYNLWVKTLRFFLKIQSFSEK